MIQVEFRSFYFNINNQGTYIYRYVVIKLEREKIKVLQTHYVIFLFEFIQNRHNVKIKT